MELRAIKSTKVERVVIKGKTKYLENGKVRGKRKMKRTKR